MVKINYLIIVLLMIILCVFLFGCQNKISLDRINLTGENYFIGNLTGINTANGWDGNYTDIVFVSDDYSAGSFVDLGYANYPHNDTPYLYFVCADNSSIEMNITFCKDDYYNASNCIDYNWNEICKLGLKQ